MKLPHGEHAVVPDEKLAGYCLNLAHPVGRHKAYLFARILGITAQSAEPLKAGLLKAAATEDAEQFDTDQVGTRYVIDFQMTTETGSAVVRSAWIIEPGSEAPRLPSCFVE